MNHVCDVIESALTAFPQCRCIETTDGTGLIAECDEAVPLIGNVGVRLQLEPCGDPAFAEVSYKFGGNWQTDGRFAADGNPKLFPTPLTVPVVDAGLYIAVTMRGNAEDLSVHMHLSVCQSSEICDDRITTWGLASLTTAFPLPVFEFSDLRFVDECPDKQSDNMMIIIIAAAAGGVVLIGVVVAIVYMKKRKQSTKAPVVTVAEAGNVQMTSATTQQELRQDKV